MWARIKRSACLKVIRAALAREFLAEDSANYFDLEDPASLARLAEPMTALGSLKGLVVIDEVQRRPDLFPVLRVLVDRKGFAGRFLILGSASGDLLRQSSETLAGRMETLTLRGFNLGELGNPAPEQHWMRGGFPLSYLAANDAGSVAWRKNFIQTLLERDLPHSGGGGNRTRVRRSWMSTGSIAVVRRISASISARYAANSLLLRSM